MLSALTAKKDYVPYANSKLTQTLADSLGFALLCLLFTFGLCTVLPEAIYKKKLHFFEVKKQASKVI